MSVREPSDGSPHSSKPSLFLSRVFLLSRAVRWRQVHRLWAHLRQHSRSQAVRAQVPPDPGEEQILRVVLGMQPASLSPLSPQFLAPAQCCAPGSTGSAPGCTTAVAIPSAAWGGLCSCTLRQAHGCGELVALSLFSQHPAPVWLSDKMAAKAALIHVWVEASPCDNAARAPALLACKCTPVCAPLRTLCKPRQPTEENTAGCCTPWLNEQSHMPLRLAWMPICKHCHLQALSLVG